MMNGLQTLDSWRNYFGNPSRGDLGLLNAIQVSEQVPADPFERRAQLLGHASAILD